MDHWDLIAAERRWLADLLDTLTPEQWATPSLCGAWSVKEVAVHLTSGPSTSVVTLLKAMAIGRGSFDRANRLLVDWRANAEPEQVAEWLREYAEHRFTRPRWTGTRPSPTCASTPRTSSGYPRAGRRRTLEPWRDVLVSLVSKAAARGSSERPSRPGLDRDRPGLVLVVITAPARRWPAPPRWRWSCATGRRCSTGSTATACLPCRSGWESLMPRHG